MQTNLNTAFKDTPRGQEADEILRACVHCGFCTATCPAYQLLGNELDGPRGRIYLIKQALEGQPVSAKTQTHLDRCLHCLSCETTCPSGVRYSQLLEIGREWVEERVARPWHETLTRKALRTVLPYPERFGPLLRLGQWLRPLLPPVLQHNVPVRRKTHPPAWPATQHARTLLILDGCVQPALAPEINLAAARVLDRFGITLRRIKGCCGAISQHLTAPEEARHQMRRNIDAWWPLIAEGAEGLVMSASGCGAMIKKYGYYLQDDSEYADKARQMAAMTYDLSEVFTGLDLSGLPKMGENQRVAFHAPCSLQHAQKITGVVEPMLTAAGFQLTPVPDAHLCCGSAGTYSILQKTMSRQLLTDKVRALESGEPDIIATANIGCLMHLAPAARVPVVHWIALFDR